MKLAALLPLLLLLPVPEPGPPGGENPFIEHYLAEAAKNRKRGRLEAAREDLERALERDDRHLEALRTLAEVCLENEDPDSAAHAYHRWLQLVDAADKPPVNRRAVQDVRKALLAIDPEAEAFRQLTDDYVGQLVGLARQNFEAGRFHAALEIYQQVLRVDPFHAEAAAGIAEVRSAGGDALAVEDVYASSDPTGGKSAAWIAEQDRKHEDWGKAWSKDGDNYRYRTNAGYLVLETSSIAMEQMNRFYRKFFRYREDGGPTPKIDVLIFKNKEEYLKLGSSPSDWSGGQFTGGSVETFVGGVTGKDTIRGMYNTLFHEAAHQFVSLTGKGGVPGWLNEGYASFFEGTAMLSNGSVKWNLPATHRLMPLADRMERGWMATASEGVKDDAGEWAQPEKAPTLRIIIEADYEWGPPWYAPTWGVVYFLYNYRDDRGVPIYRDALHEYYLSGAAGRGDKIAHFEEVVLAAPSSPVRTVDELSGLWRDWIMELRDIALGLSPPAKGGIEYGDAARERGDDDLALEFYEEAHVYQGDEPEVVWRLASLLAERGEHDRASSLLRTFRQEMAARGLTDDARYAEAAELIEKLDPLHIRLVEVHAAMADKGLALARSYRERGMPRMAMEIALRTNANGSSPAVLDFYRELARETGITLARWKVAYNENDLEDWSGADGYRAYGKMIEATVLDDPSLTAGKVGEFMAQELACDVAFDSDYSLEAEMRFGADASLMGLCFGRKDSNNTHAVVLHPKGYLDISTKHGTNWTIRDHRQVSIDEDWQKLRIDVVGNVVDVYLNGQYLRTLELPSADSVRGSFGLITGTGSCQYRSIRLLARDPYDPAPRIERELTMERIAGDSSLRASGNFSGFEPPPIQVEPWIQGEATDLAALKGRPVALIFWAISQDEVIPTTGYYQHLASEFGPLGVEFLVVVNSEHAVGEVRGYLDRHPMPGVRVALDDEFRTYNAYNVKPGGFGLPRLLLLDVDGRVTWEGDPGFRSGEKWSPGKESYFDAPLSQLIKKRSLRELAAERGRLERARALLDEGRAAEAWTELQPLAELRARFDPDGRAAAELSDLLEAEAQRLPEKAHEAAAAGRPLLAEAMLREASAFAHLASAEEASAQLKKLRRERDFKSAQKAWKSLVKAAQLAEKGSDPAKIAKQLDAAAGSDGLEVTEALAALRAALEEGGAEIFLARWHELQPQVRVES